MKRQLETLIGSWLAGVVTIFIRAVTIMFVAAVIWRNWGVWAAVGYQESLAWSAGYGLVKGLWEGEKS